MHIRQYPDGRQTYSLGAMTDGEMGVLYPEDWLEPTGGRAALAEFSRPGLLRIRDLVRIGPAAPEAIRGKTGHITALSESGSDVTYWVYLDDLGEDTSVSAEDLEPTGDRLPPPAPGPRSSIRVNEAGGVAGHDEYFVLDDLEWHF